MSTAIPRFLGRFWGLLILFGGMVFWGWWLAALAVSGWMALSIAALIVYLLAVGTGGVIPASVYLSLWVAVSVAMDVFPSFWPQDLHYKYWAFTLMFLWAAGLGYCYLVAKQGNDLKQRPAHLRRWRQGALLVGLLIAMGVGAGLYQ